MVADSPDDVVLEDGDSLIVPRRPSSVNVLGQVYAPTAIVYDRRFTIRDYIGKAGGPTELSDPKAMMLVKADGSTVTLESYKNAGRNGIFPLMPLVSDGFMGVHPEPGDTIYVPDRIIYMDSLEVSKDIATIIG